MNKQEIENIKQKALEEHIPIIMDDTLDVIAKYLKEKDIFFQSWINGGYYLKKMSYH